MTSRIERTRIGVPALRSFVTRAIEAVGVGPEDAKLVADVLTTSDIRGIESHGVARLETFYVDRILDGTIDARAVATTIHETPTLLAVDAQNGLGHPVAVRTMRRAARIRSRAKPPARQWHSATYGSVSPTILR